MESTTISKAEVTLKRIVGHIQQGESGPTLICLAALHGNEPAGLYGLKRVLARLEEDFTGFHGEFFGVVGNRKAVEAARRYIEFDLNRAWTDEQLRRIRNPESKLKPEGLEQRELDTFFRGVIAEASGPVFVIDLHTTSGPSPAFVVLDDRLDNRAFAMNFPAPIVLGLEEELDGTLLHYLENLGLTTMGFESGQHEEPAAVDRAEAAIWIALAASGVIEPTRREVGEARDRLIQDNKGLPRAVEVRHRQAITNGEVFTMDPGWTSFKEVSVHQRLAENDKGPVLAPERGRILMPLYQKQGNDGFFIVRKVRPSWLRVSSFVRRAGFERFLHWLPGVHRHPEEHDTYLVNRHVARWFALEIFHLLGFRRHGESGEHLTVSRRQ